MQVCVWVDAADSLDPENVAGSGVDLDRLLWVRCGAMQMRTGGQADDLCDDRLGVSVDKSISVSGASGVSGSPHPRREVRGLLEAVGNLFAATNTVAKSAGNEQRKSSLVPPRRRDRSIGTPGAPNRALSGSIGGESFPRQSKDREEQVASDRRVSRRRDAVHAGRTVAQWAPRCSEALRQGHTVRANDAVWCQERALQATPKHEATHLRDRDLTSGVADAGMPRLAGLRTYRGPWTGVDHALRATDLLLQGGGFGVIVLDLGDIAPEAVWQIPLSTWFRFRAAAERTQTSLLLLTQHACARSCAELVLEMEPGEAMAQGRVMEGMTFQTEVARQRFASRTEMEQREKIVSMQRKSPQPERTAKWMGQASWMRHARDSQTLVTGRKRGPV